MSNARYSTTMKQLDPEVLNRQLDTTKVVIIDVREEHEYEREHIAGSRNVPLTRLSDIDLSQDLGKVAVFHCKSGFRTQAAADRLQSLGFRQAYCLKGGIDSWKACGFDVRTKKQRKQAMAVENKIYLIIGMLTLLSAMLTLYVNSGFAWVSGVIGFAMILSGFTGFCALRKLLTRNKAADDAEDTAAEAR